MSRHARRSRRGRRTRFGVGASLASTVLLLSGLLQWGLLLSGLSTPTAVAAELGTAAPGDAAVPVMMVLDASGSMNQADAPGPRIDAAKAAVDRPDRHPARGHPGRAAGLRHRHRFHRCREGRRLQGHQDPRAGRPARRRALRAQVTASSRPDTRRSATRCGPPPRRCRTRVRARSCWSPTARTPARRPRRATSPRSSSSRASTWSCTPSASRSTPPPASSSPASPRPPAAPTATPTDAGQLSQALATKVDYAITGYTTAGTPVTGADQPSEQAPLLTPGQYIDTFAVGGVGRRRCGGDDEVLHDPGPGGHAAVHLRDAGTAGRRRSTATCSASMRS